MISSWHIPMAHHHDSFTQPTPRRCMRTMVWCTSRPDFRAIEHVHRLVILVIHSRKLMAGTQSHGGLEDDFSFSNGWFSGSILVFGGVYAIYLEYNSKYLGKISYRWPSFWWYIYIYIALMYIYIYCILYIQSCLSKYINMQQGRAWHRLS